MVDIIKTKNEVASHGKAKKRQQHHPGAVNLLKGKVSKTNTKRAGLPTVKYV